MEWTSISVERLINGYRTFNFFLRGLPRLPRAFDDKTFHKLFIKWSRRMGDKEQHFMQMWLCTTIITNISWFPHVFAGRPAVRGPASMLAGLWQHKLRVIWWLIKWQSNTCMDYEIAAWMGLVSSPRWMEMKETKCNFSFFLSSITQFRGPGTQKPIHPIVIHENEILARDRDRSISLEISLVSPRL